jgi:glutamyl-tRNA reductase
MSPNEIKEAGEKKLDFELRLIGVNHRTAASSIREALTYADPEAARWIRLAVEKGAVDLAGREIREAALLSTCNRTEAYLVLSPTGGSGRGGEHGAAQPELERRLARLLCGTRHDILDAHADIFDQRRDAAAVHHLLRVASGLDSMVQGEAQILGQVHRAHELSREAEGVGPILDRLFTTAFRAGKRSRNETEIGRGAVSVASAAVELARKVVGSLNRRTALVVGAGDTGRLVAQHFASEQPHELMIANRTLDRARALAAEVGARALGLDDLPRVLDQADVIVVATFAPQPVITKAMVQTALKHRRRSTVFIDISMPRNVEPSVHGLGEAFVYDIDALQKIVRENLNRREDEVPKVEAILEAELQHFMKWLGSLSAGPMIAALRDRFERIRQEEVERHTSGLTPQERKAVERVSRGLVNKFLHGPTVHLRNGGTADPMALDLVRRMFQLEEEAPAESEDPRPDPDAAEEGSR